MLSWIHDFAPSGVITTDGNLCVQSWNHFMETHSGKTAASVVGRSILDLYPDLKERGLAPRFIRALEGEVSVLSTALHGYLLPLEPSIRESGFEEMRQTARIAPLRYQSEVVGLVITIEDVTQREFQAMVLRRQHEREKILSWALGHLLESPTLRGSVRELFCKVAELFDLDAYVLYLRQADGKGFRLHGLGGVPPEAEQKLSVLEPGNTDAEIFLKAQHPMAFENILPGASEVDLLQRYLGLRACALLPLVAGEGRLGVLCFGTRTRATLEEGELDLLATIAQYLAVALAKEETTTKLRDAQAQLNVHAQKLEIQVNERTAKLREIITELETFSYTVAHDLRAPIRALTGYSLALLEDFSNVLPDEAKSIVHRMEVSCSRLDALTRDLLAFTKVSRQEIKLQPIDLEEVLSEVLSLTQVGASDVTIRRPLEKVMGQRTLLQQSLANLVDNALKFVKEGKTPRITIWTEAVGDESSASPSAGAQPFTPVQRPTRSSASSASGRVRIIVQDEGIGIAPEAHGKVFGIFERGTSSPKYSGSGIGLAIVARAIQRMGGAYGLESQLGVGSKFWLELPAAPSDV